MIPIEGKYTNALFTIKERWVDFDWSGNHQCGNDNGYPPESISKSGVSSKL